MLEGNARIAIRTLRNAAIHADNRITEEHVVGAWRDARRAEELSLLYRLTADHRRIYSIVERHGEILSGDLWEEYVKECRKEGIKPLSRRSFQEYVNRLIAEKLITAEKARVRDGRPKIAEDQGFKVLYGDTDSIFVKKDGLSLKELKREIGRLIGKLREDMPIQIDIDEYYDVVFFVEKKRYAGLTSDGRIIVKGIEVRRGDWCELAKQVQRKVIEIILKERSPEKAVEYVREIIDEIKKRKNPDRRLHNLQGSYKKTIKIRKRAGARQGCDESCKEEDCLHHRLKGWLCCFGRNREYW